MQFETTKAGRDSLHRIGEWLDLFPTDRAPHAVAGSESEPILFEDWAPMAFGAPFVIGDALWQIFG